MSRSSPTTSRRAAPWPGPATWCWRTLPRTLAELAALGAAPRRSAVIPHGPLPVASPAAWLRRPGSAGGPRRFLFFGRVQSYKGVTDLLAAFAALPAETPAELTVAGPCPDRSSGPGCGRWPPAPAIRVTLRLDRVPDAR